MGRKDSFMKRIFLGAISASLLAFGASAAAAQERYVCEFNQAGNAGGWIPQQVGIDLDRAAGIGRVALPVEGEWEWFEGRIDRLNAQQFVLLVSRTTSDRTNQQATMNYRFVYRFGNRSMRATATPLGYANSFTARGACAQQ
jgi:opacity protein-like surface antigen